VQYSTVQYIQYSVRESALDRVNFNISKIFLT